MLKQNDKLYNFTVEKVVESKELGGRLVYLRHDKAGTELVWTDNGELNKLFAIAFKTLPENSTGVFHILEHSVLCGSEKYPVKEPFVDLLKSSMNTFLNALTFQDKTMYPVSSRNEKDFLNLTGVYLDAVFAPNILRNPNIFYQEGWHIEIDEEGNPSYKGVVFNEMKGVMGSKDGFLSEKLISYLFPDNCYGVNSGGDPECIPDLSYEEFVATYKKFYHASNARIYLDGSIPVDETLALIDSYLSRFDRLETLPSCPRQVPKACNETLYYALGRDEEKENKTQITMAKIFADWSDVVKINAAGVLFGALCDSNESAFKKAVLESGYAQDIEFSMSEESEQVFFAIDLKNVTDGKEDEIVEIVKNVAREQIEKGIDRKALIAAINSGEFKSKAPEEPAALIRSMKALVSWLYGGDPIIYLEYEEVFRQLRAMLETDGFEKLLSEMLLDDAGLCIMKALPSYTANEERDEQEKARLKAIVGSWSEEEKAANKKLNEELSAWQQTPDSKENSNTIPKLPLTELSDEPDLAPTEVKECCGTKLLYHEVNTNGIVNIAMYFNLSDLTLEEITPAAALGQLLGYLPTKKYNALELEQEIKTYLGDIGVRFSVYSENNDLESATPCMVLTCSVLESNLSHAKELIDEILFETEFDKDMIFDILQQSDMRARQAASVAGHAVGRLVAMSGFSAEDAVNEALLGYSSIRWSHKIVGEYEAMADDFIALLKRVLKNACCKKRLTMSETCGKFVELDCLLSRFEDGAEIPAKAAYKSNLPKRSGIKIPAQISYAVQCSNIKNLGFEYDGSMAVAANILTLDYLWNKVRVQGGAYGTGMKIGLGGGMMTYSYRDPSPKRSIEANEDAGKHLLSCCEDREELEKYIISTISATEPLVTPMQRGFLADRDYFRAYSKEIIRNQRREMLLCDREKLSYVAKCADAFAKEGSICIVGPEDKLADFENIVILEM